MKKQLQIILLLINFTSFAQYTAIPDANFENALSQYDDIPNDGQIPTANINTVTNLNVRNLSISDLTGVEDFIALKYLNCDVNQLTSINVTNNIDLIELHFFANQISNIDVSNNTNLKIFDCGVNQLTSLDVSFNSALTVFSCAGNQLTSLNIKNGNNTNIANDSFYANNNPDLTCIEVDDVAYSTANWTNIDPASSFSENCHFAETYVPDNNFENYLETHDASGNTVAVGDVNSVGNGTANDDYVTTANINTVAYLDVHNLDIADLTGIEDFTALQTLICSNNQLTSIDVTQNIALQSLRCSFNQLTNLDLSQNIALKILGCYYNHLTNLDVSQNIVLTYLACGHNQLSSMDVSHNTELQEFGFNHNQFSSMDLTQNNLLIQLYCYNNQLTSLNIKNGNNTNIDTNSFKAYNNPDLTCIEVDVVAYSTANWTNIDPASSFSENCHFAETYVPDDNFENYLETHNTNGNTVAVGDVNSMGNGIANDDYVTTANINTVTNLNVRNLSISDLTGIEDFFALKYLNCDINQLTSINVTNNIDLIELHLFSNQISNIDVSNNTNLKIFDCGLNQLTSLDVSFNSALTVFSCAGNQLTSLNIKNGNNTNIGSDSFYANNNPDLTCIEVDDIVYSTENWTHIDPESSFSENCHYGETYVPDDKFENYLETHNANGNTVAVGDSTSMGNGIENDDYVTTANINTVTNLNVVFKHINDLTGIEDFEALITLDCTLNNISSLNISQNTALKTLKCAVNQITNLDVSNNLDLSVLWCYSNQLSNLGISSNLALTDVKVYTNQLTVIDVSHNINLLELDCSNNQLDNLDIANNINLKTLGCSQNQLTSLDVTHNTNLEILGCSKNQLEDIDLTQNVALVNLYCFKNKLVNLDLRLNSNLKDFRCQYNNLTSLNIKNGNNTNILTSYFNATNNPDLTCIEVDDVAYSTEIWTNIDSASSFSTSCYCENRINVTEYSTSGWSNGFPDLSKCVIINQDFNTTSFSAYLIKVNVNKTLTIAANTYTQVKEDIENNGTITVEPTGSIVQIDNLAKVTGAGVFNTKIATTPLQDATRFTYFSLPTKDETLNTFASWGDLNYLWEYNANTQSWVYLNDASEEMKVGNGYIVRGNSSNTYPDYIGTTNFQQAFNNGVITRELNFKGDGSTTANIDNDGNLVGNPYPSAINGIKLLNSTLNPTAGTLYFWTHNSGMVDGDFGTDDYAIWNLSGGVTAISGGTAPTGYIASGQGFFIDAEGDETLPLGQDVTSTLTFNNEMRETLNNTDFRILNLDTRDDKIWINLTNTEGVFNQMLIAFLPNATVNFDKAYDGKRVDNGVATIYSIGNRAQHYAIEATSLLQNETIIPLGCKIENEDITHLKISIDHLENMDDVEVYLIDNNSDVIHNLTKSDYSFQVNGNGEFNDRFELLFRTSTLSNNDIILNEGLIVSNQSDNTILVKTTRGSIIKKVEVYDVLGKLIISENNQSNRIDLNATQINQGTVLFIKAYLDSNSILNKKIIKL